MSRKRRQRSTAIRKRIEKKQREDKKAALRAGRHSDRDEETPLTMRLDQGVAARCAAEIEALRERLEQGPIRGWTTHDLEGEGGGLVWLAGALDEAAKLSSGGEVELQILRGARSGLLDKLNALEMAASGLSLDWEAGFLELGRSISHAEEPPPPEEDEEDEEDE